MSSVGKSVGFTLQIGSSLIFNICSLVYCNLFRFTLLLNCFFSIVSTAAVSDVNETGECIASVGWELWNKCSGVSIHNLIENDTHSNLHVSEWECVCMCKYINYLPTNDFSVVISMGAWMNDSGFDLYRVYIGFLGNTMCWWCFFVVLTKALFAWISQVFKNNSAFIETYNFFHLPIKETIESKETIETSFISYV